TGAQWMCVAMVPIGIYVLTKVRPALARALAAGEVGGTPVFEKTTRTAADGRTVSTTKRRTTSNRPAHTTRAAGSSVGTTATATDPADDADTADDPDESSASASAGAAEDRADSDDDPDPDGPSR
ncbi:MAG TPA: hypothetical protein VF228_18870, partial [Iamia sp.]